MQVVIIGSGNVATVLANRMHGQGISIKEVYSQSYAHANLLATKVNAKALNNLENISQDADLYLIAVSDKAIESIVSQLKLPNKLVVHTAGSVSIQVLQQASNKIGVLYPVQSLRTDMNEATLIPFLIDGNTTDTIQQLEELAKLLHSPVAFGNDEVRAKLHVAAVFACNFVNYMYVQSALFCEKEQIPFSLLQPLIEETANRLQNNHPSTVFTGPAVRGDIQTINKHLELLSAYPEQEKLYSFITQLIMGTKK